MSSAVTLYVQLYHKGETVCIPQLKSLHNCVVQVAAIPGRSSTPTNQVYPVVEPAYTPPPVVTSPNPILGGPGTVLATQLAPVADRSIVSENSIPEGGVETEGDTPTKVGLLFREAAS